MRARSCRVGRRFGFRSFITPRDLGYKLKSYSWPGPSFSDCLNVRIVDAFTSTTCSGAPPYMRSCFEPAPVRPTLWKALSRGAVTLERKGGGSILPSVYTNPVNV